MSSTPERWPRPVPDGRRIHPEIPPLVDRLVRDMVQVRAYGEEEQVAEATHLTVAKVEHQFAQTNHPTLKLFLGWVAVVGPERASAAATPVLSRLGVALVPSSDVADPGADPSESLVRLTEQLGALAQAHLSTWRDRRMTAAELAALERLGAHLKHSVDLYLSTARVLAEARR